MLGSDSEAGTPNLRQHGRFGRSERNFLVLCVTMAAIVLLVGNGGSTLSHIVASAKGVGIGPDRLLPTALLLNIALIVFGWVRYDDLGHEVGERRHAEQQARWLAETDPLTGCLNRRSIGPATEALIAAAAARGEVAGFIMVDLDRFKQINDLNGHAVGDRLLCECARRIRSLLPPGSLVARLGGDEFACVVAFNPHQREAIDHLAASLVRGMSAPVIVEGYEGEVTASLGLTRSDANSNGATHGSAAIAYDELLNMADIAMYQAKKQGRNQHKWFEASMAAELRYRSDLENAIRLGIANAEFVPYYEQQIDLLKGDLVGFEMLARWQSPTLGIVGPEVFIPVAEDMGVIA
jgi:diguanylate cyclase (GGDEF)-like protein